MSDDLNMTPQLTLTPEADAAPEAPALTLDPAPEAAAQQAAAEAERQKERDANAVKVDESMLSEAERKMVDDFAQKIDVTDSNVVLQYGSAAQKNIASFSENALNSVKTKDLGEVGEALSDLVVELKNFGKDEEKKGGLFKKGSEDKSASSNDTAKSSKKEDRPKKKRFQFFRDVKSEMKRVTWPTRTDVLRWSGVVVVALLFFGIFVALLDNVIITPLLVFISGIGA